MTEFLIALLCIAAVLVNTFGAIRSAHTHNWKGTVFYASVLILFSLALYAIAGEAVI